jgi:hypothetical protein
MHFFKFELALAARLVNVPGFSIHPKGLNLLINAFNHAESKISKINSWISKCNNFQVMFLMKSQGFILGGKTQTDRQQTDRPLLSVSG